MKKVIITVLIALFVAFELTDVMLGTVTNMNRDGHVDWSSHTLCEPFTYINYNGIDCIKGDRILTLEVYSPLNLEDGIVFRKDMVIK